MPVTPFHFGPGAMVHAVVPKHVSFLAFCAANVLIDIEPLYFMLTRQFPLHRFFHTYVGASIVAGATVLLFAAARRAAPTLRLPNSFDWQCLGMKAVAFGAVIGAFSHVALDSIMHADIRPFAPFSPANPLLNSVPIDVLHGLCVVTAAAGIAVLGLRRNA